ncbi:transposase [Emticicia sp.]|uniref:transposase n=1 Tax=Emticicia sp. TaxID=1930953 RepID=UPI003752C0BF
MKNNEIPLLPNEMYHIYNHANGHENLFVKRENFNYFLKRYAEYINPIAQTFAYCLMPNHFHFMVKINNIEGLQLVYQQKMKMKDPENDYPPLNKEYLPKFISREFGSLFSAYSQAFNKQQKRMGSLFMPNFKRKIVDSDSYYTSLIHYIHSNPVHHGFVNNAYEWEHSSLHSFISQKSTQLKREEALNWFGDLENFKTFQSEVLPEKLTENLMGAGLIIE